MPDIRLQPKQWELLDAAYRSPARVIGCGGGRGSAKSGGIDRVALTLMVEQPGIASCIVMRTYEQIRKYHIDPLLRCFPELRKYYSVSSKKLVLPVGSNQFSQLDLGYAENYDAVEQFFRSGNYKYIFLDQGEQFDERELREIRKANRWPGGGAKTIIAHNMGGIGISTLRKWFHTKEYNERESAENYHWIRFDPWNNVEWVRSALAQDGLTEKDYYSWTDDQRREYAEVRGEYTKELASDDDAIRNRDWLGSWDCLEGAYFGSTFDLASTRINPEMAQAMRKPWAVGWLSQDWGKTHFCVTYWHYRITMGPDEVKACLGWDVRRPLNVVVTYREYVDNEKTSAQIGEQIVHRTPDVEREWLKAFYLSPECCADGPNTIAGQIGKELRPHGMPWPSKADNDRIGGYTLMSKLLLETKMHGSSTHENDVWLISSNCPNLLNSLPMLMRDPKNLDDVLKTDKGAAKIEQDCSEAARYGLKTMLAPRGKSPEDIDRERVLSVTDAGARFLEQFKVTHAREDRNRKAEERRPAHWE